MVTSYRIEPGYNSSKDHNEVWETLKQVVVGIQEQPNLIVEEVLRFESKADKVLIEEYAACYKPPVEDLTIKVYDEDEAVIQSASGGGPSRDAKESCRRAFCRLVLHEMHLKKMEVSIIVC